ncbi:MAG: hypothetical protein ACYDBW_06050 [Sulfuricaulis sp.]
MKPFAFLMVLAVAGLLNHSAAGAELTKKTYRIAALNGGTPAQPTRVDFAVNLKAAKTEEHLIPPSILLRADETIR